VKVLVLNASMKHGNELSNTEEVTNMVLDEMRKHGQVEAETIRLADTYWSVWAIARAQMASGRRSPTSCAATSGNGRVERKDLDISFP
jgi:hypothetical protein